MTHTNLISQKKVEMLAIFAFNAIRKVKVAPFSVGKQMGLIVSLRGTLSFSRKSAMSLSKLRKLKSPVNTLTTYLVSAPLSVHLSCSPNVTLIMNHMNLKMGLAKLIMLLWRTESSLVT